MGRKPWSNRRLVEDCRALGIALLVRSGLFSPWIDSNGYRYEISRTMEWKSGLAVCVTRPGAYVDDDSCPTSTSRDELELIYETGGCEIEESIQIVSISSLLRRQRRFYFRCPGWDDAPCQKRAGKLYLPPGEHFFRCRACHDLTYRSVKEHDKRVDALIRAPMALNRVLHDSYHRSSTLGVRALSHLLRREK